MSSSRVANSLRNVFAAWGGQAVSAIASFVVRMAFVSCLAQEYLGLETLFSSLLTILALADLGIGGAIVFSLYEPLANGNKELVKSLMRLFKRAYILIGVVIIGIGLLLAPNVHMLLGADAPDIPLLEVYFFCFVLNTGVSYFFSYKGSLIMADQKGYVVYLIQYGFQIVMACAQIAVLYLTHNYLIFLACMIASTILQNIVIAIRANKMYPYLREKDIQPLNKEVLETIKKNVLGLIMHKVAGVASTPVSNIVITTFAGLTVTSLYGNYLLITNSLSRIVDRVFDSIVASVGNLGAKESESRQYEVFKTTFFINAFLYACISGGLLCSVNAFISIWVGDSWRFGQEVVVFIVLLFYVKGMRCAAVSFTSAYGLYWYTKWKAVLEAVFLPILSLILVGPLGIVGVLLAGVITSVCISTVYEAWAVYAHGFHHPLSNFAIAYVKYALLAAFSIGIAYLVSSIIPVTGVLAFLTGGFFGVFVPFLFYVVAYRKSRELREVISIVKRFLPKRS